MNICLKEEWQAHKDSVQFIDISTDGTWLVSGSFDERMKLWDLENKKELWDVQGNFMSCEVVEIHPNNRIVASGGGGVYIWDSKTKSKIIELRGHKNWVFCLTFSSNGKYLATGSMDNTIKIWDTESWELLNTLRGHNNSLFHLSFFSNDELLVSSARDNSIMIWDVQEGRSIKKIEGFPNTVYCTLPDKNNKFFYSACHDNNIYIYNENYKCISQLEGHNNGIMCMCIMEDMNLLCSGDRDGVINFWDLSNLTFVNAIKITGEIMSVKSFQNQLYCSNTKNMIYHLEVT